MSILKRNGNGAAGSGAVASAKDVAKASDGPVELAAIVELAVAVDEVGAVVLLALTLRLAAIVESVAALVVPVAAIVEPGVVAILETGVRDDDVVHAGGQ